MHHQLPMHHSQHPLLSNQLQPINPDTHTSMWLEDPYAVSNASASQRDSGFNSRPASLRSIDSTVTNNTAPLHHGPPAMPTGYEQLPPPPPLPPDHEHMHPQYTELQSAPAPPARPDPNQVIPELLNLLMEDDPVIVHEAVGLIYMLVREGGEGRSEVIRHREVNLIFNILSPKNSLLVNSYSFGKLFQRFRRWKSDSCSCQSLSYTLTTTRRSSCHA